MKFSISEALAYSRYLKRLTEANPTFLAESYRQAPYSRQQMEAFIQTTAVSDEATLKRTLRQLRQQVFLNVSLRDLTGLADLAEVVATMSDLAEVCICSSLHYLTSWLEKDYGLASGTYGPQPLLVIAMGKLGGRELNVSSDIDLIFIYPEEGETAGPRRISNHEFFVQLSRRFIGVLSEVTPEGFVFRVDMRLRPYGDSGALAISFDALEDYFITQGREWERYAWIKARVVNTAASASYAQKLNELVRPFVFRKYLDYGALESMRQLHAQIQQEVTRRDLADHIKLGPGGIREIEFIAQVFQLIRGGRDAELQICPMREVLALLGKKNVISSECVTELSQAYVFLRNLEHRLQYIDDQQTHVLPKNEQDQHQVAQAMGYETYAGFLEQLYHHRQQVSHYFEKIFAKTGANSCFESRAERLPVSLTSPSGRGAGGEGNGQGRSFSAFWLNPEQASIPQLELFETPQQVRARLTQIRQSKRYQLLPSESRERFDALIPRLIEQALSFAKPDTVLLRLLDLAETISGRSAYLALLYEFPKTLEKVAQIATVSWAADYLKRHPLLLDELLDMSWQAYPPDWAVFNSALQTQLNQYEQDVERQMNLLREAHHAQVFRLLIQDLAGIWTIEKLSDYLTELADILLQATLMCCWNNLKQKHRQEPKFAVIGYGKLGGKELGYASDLDLIFIYHDPSVNAPENYARLAQRLNTWLTSTTSSGILFETDLRLRPDGEGGLLVSSLDTFRDYQGKSAWTWEHQALTRARFVCGDKEIGEQFEMIRKTMLQKKRALDALKQDILAMRQKMLDAHPNESSLFDVKHDRGGIIDVEFVVQYLVLAHAHDFPEMTGNIGNIALLKLAGTLNFIPLDLAIKAGDAYREYRRIQHKMRLDGERFVRVSHEQIQNCKTTVQQLWQVVFNTQGFRI